MKTNQNPLFWPFHRYKKISTDNSGLNAAVLTHTPLLSSILFPVLMFLNLTFLHIRKHPSEIHFPWDGKNVNYVTLYRLGHNLVCGKMHCPNMISLNAFFLLIPKNLLVRFIFNTWFTEIQGCLLHSWIDTLALDN